MSKDKNRLWLRWTVANSLGELIGLGATFVVAGLLIPKINSQHITGLILTFAIAVLSGSLEATVVGLAQWWAFHPWFPTITRQDWWRATMIGALLGYVLGYLPSTIMSMNEVNTQTSASEPPQWVMLLLETGLGVLAGMVLSFMQWRILHQAKVKRAGLWIPANMLAWAFGMPLIFAGMDLAFTISLVWQSIFIIAGALLAAGLIVGAIHGRFLIVLVGNPEPHAAAI